MTEQFTGAELRAQCLTQFRNVVVQSSMVAHEGRHAIDPRLRVDLDTWEREFRAEVAFATLPFLALGAIVNPNIGDDTPHGRANAKIMEGLVDCMRDHADEIQALDSALPLLPQLDKLTDDQLRSAFASMDPLGSDSGFLQN